MTAEEPQEEGYDAGDKCGRCGCKRREHTPACTGCQRKCKGFSEPKDHRPKRKR
jgi:hypothetical protein